MAAVKTPSKNNEKAIEHIDMLVGSISENEELIKAFTDDVDKTILKDDLINKIVSSNELQTRFLQTTASMLVAIAGYLYGEKGIGLDTKHTELLSKVKNNSPILGDKSMQQFIVDEDAPNSDNEGLLNLMIEVKGITGNDLQALSDVINALKTAEDVDEIAELDAIVSMVGILEQLTKNLSKVDFSMFTDEYANSVANFNITLDNLTNTNSRLIKNIPAILALEIFKDNILDYPKTIAEFISGTNSKGGLVMIMNKLNKAEAAGLDIEKLNIFFEGVLTLTNILTKLGISAKVSAKFSTSIIKNVELITAIINKISDVKTKSITASLNNIESINKFMLGVKDVFLISSLCGLLSVPALLGVSAIWAATKLIFNVIENISKLKSSVVKTSLLNFENIVLITKKIGSIFVSLAICGLLAVPALLGIGAIWAATKLIFNVIENISNLKVNIVKTSLENFDKIVSITISLQKIFTSLAICGLLAVPALLGIGAIWAATKLIFNVIDNISKLKTNVVKTTLSNFEKISILTKDLQKIFISLAVCGLLAIPALIGIGTVLVVSKILNVIIETISKIKIVDITLGVENIENVGKMFTTMRSVFITLAICGILAIPAVIGLAVIWVATKLIFSIIKTVTDGLDKIGDVKDISKKIKNLGFIVLTLGLILTLAALVGNIVLTHAGNILGFALVLTAFITLIMLPFVLINKLFGKGGDNLLKSIDNIRGVIITCSLVMVLGALFMLTGLWLQALLFGAVLGLFITTVLFPFTIYGKFFRKAIKSADEIAILIVTCTLVLMIGALFMKTGLWLNAILFGLLLGAFILMVLSPFILFMRNAKNIEKSIKAITSLVITCTLILIIGALFMLTGWWKEAIEFVLILGLFVWLITLPFILFGKNIMKCAPALYALAILVVVSTIVLMIGANYIRDYGSEDILIFGAILLGFVVIMASIAVALGKIKNIAKGIAVMAAIVAISILASVSLGLMAETSKIADMTALLGIVGVMIAIIVALGGLTVAMGALTLIPFFWAGLGAMAAVAGIALIFSAAIKNIAEAIAVLAKVDKDGGINPERILTIIGYIPIIGAAVAGSGAALGTSMPLIIMTSIACLSMAKMISKIGTAVADISNLKVGTKWDSNGNAIEFRQLNETDFKNAAQNIKTIVSVLGKAIIDVYAQNPSLFEVPMVTEKTWWGGTRNVSGKKTKFQMVVEACSSLGTMISLIGKGVADIADMKVATDWNSEGKPIAFRHLKQADFNNAAINISTIVSVLSKAIMDIYAQNPSMFEVPMITEKTWWGGTRKVSGKTTIFEKVVTACSSMGSMISLIGKGVSEFATMQVATKWNSEGKPIEYKRLTDGDIKNAIVNISTIISTLFNALNKAYTENQSIFDAKLEWVNGHLVSNVPVYRVISSGMLAGKMISSLAQGVSDVANLRIANKWNNEGVAIGFSQMTDKDFENYKTNVEKIISSTFNALMNSYNLHPDWFESFEFNAGIISFKKNSPLKSIIQSAQGAGAIITELAKGVQSILDLKMTDDNGKKINVNIADFEDGGKLSIIVKAITLSLLNSLNDAYTKTPKGITDHIKWFKSIANEQLIPIVKDLSTIATSIIEGFKSDDINNSASRITTFSMHLTNAMNALYKMQNIEGVKEKLDNYVNSIIESLSKNANLVVKYFSDKGLVAAAVKLRIFTNNLLVAIIAFKNIKAKTLQTTEEKLKNHLLPICVNLIYITKMLNNTFTNVNVDKVISDYNSLIIGLFTPFESVNKRDIDKFKTLFTKRNRENVSDLVKSINSLNEDKVDKFIELSQEIRELSTSVGDIASLVNALNGRINDTLEELSDRLTYAADTIKSSDMAQDKRQKIIEANAKKLEKVFNKPVEVKISKAMDTPPSIGTERAGATGASPQVGSNGSSSNRGNDELVSEISALCLQINKLVEVLSK